MELNQNVPQKASNPVEINAGQKYRSAFCDPNKIINRRIPAKYRITIDKHAATVEKRLTLKAIEPRGKKVTAFARRLYMGNPAGWLIPKVKAVLTNSGESWWKMVGAMVARYNHQAKKIKKKWSGCYGIFS